jgi:hypothetical protein
MATKVSDIFDIRYGQSLELNSLVRASPEDGIAFISRKRGDNGISAYVEPVEGIEYGLPGEISCALSGNGVLTTCLQEQPFYTGYHVAILSPKNTMTKAEILYYCACIKSNRYRYSYGRQANKTIAGLVVPSINEIPSWVNTSNLNPFKEASSAVSDGSTQTLNLQDWVEFRYDEIFKIEKGYYNKKPPKKEGSVNLLPFIGATDSNNGVTSYHCRDDVAVYSRNGEIIEDEPISRKIFSPNCITVSNNGSVGYAFFQPEEFVCSHDVNPLYLTAREMTKNIGMFLCTIIGMDRYRWNYGRKWRPARMPNSIIKLPTKSNGEPDWDFMENYVKTLPYSRSI